MLTQEEILKGNEAIALFMGLSYCKDSLKGSCSVPSLSELKFATSWDWLMPVVEMIETTAFANDVYYDFNIIGGCQVLVISQDGDEVVAESEKTKILSVYVAVLKFIKWHETNKNL